MNDFIKEFIINGELIINKIQFNELNSKYSVDEIKDCITKHILNGDVKFPYYNISYDECFEEFKKLCKTEPIKLLKGNCYTKVKYKSKLSDLYLESGTIGNKASNYFHEKNRFEVRVDRFPSPTDIWKRESSIKSILNPIWTLKIGKIDSKVLRTCISVRAYVASQFKPIIAKSIYSMFNAKRVLDTSSGWGDRLCGFFATDGTEEYVGVDPNSSLQNGYLEQIKMYQKIYPNKNAQVICDGAEFVDFSKFGKFDFIFTSPPYFNCEKYSQDEKQSYKLYKSSDSWLNNFLFVWIKNAWESLEDNGHMVINISDIYAFKEDYSHKKGDLISICDPMVDYVVNELGGSYIGEFGMRLSQRPNMTSLKDEEKNGIFFEPCWVFYKGDKSKIIDKYSVDYQIMNNEINRESIFDLF